MIEWVAPLFAQNAPPSNAALVTFILYSLVVFGLALAAHYVLTGKKFISEYFLGSRGLGPIALTLSYGATSASAGTFAGTPALIYTHGWVVALWLASYTVVPLCGFGLLGKRINQVARRADAITVPDVLRERFESTAVGLLATMLIAVLLSVYLVPQFKVGAIILRQLLQGSGALQAASQWMLPLTHAGVPLTGGNDAEYLACLVLFAVIVVFYTMFGGFRAVVWTDVLQGFVMVFGVALLLVLALWQVGGMRTAVEKMSVMTPPRLGAVQFVAPNASSQDRRIETDTWFTYTSGNQDLLLRTNELAIIPAGKLNSNDVKVVQITTPSEEDEIRAEHIDPTAPNIPPGITVKFPTPLQDYAYGADTPGVYISAPGPSQDNDLGFVPFGVAISFFFFWALTGAGQPGNMVRLMACDSTKTFKKAICGLTVYFGLIYFPLVVIFCCARVLEPGLDQDADRIMPHMAFELSKWASVPWLAGILVAAPFAAAMSTVDSFMLMISSALVRDVYQKTLNPDASQRSIKWLSYACTLLIGLVAMLGAVNPPQFLQYLIVFTGSGLGVAFLVPTVLALYWPRMNTAGMLSSMLGGLAVFLAAYFTFADANKNGWSASLEPFIHYDPVLYGLGASLLFGVLVSLATRPPPDHLVRKFFCAET